MIPVRLIADDLTGALDGAAPFAELGLSATLCLAPSPGAPAWAAPGTLVEVASTDSRRVSAPQAARRVAEHLRQHPLAPGTLLIKKIDSLLRGPYAFELRELMQAAHRTTAVICPALPRMHRFLLNSRLWSDGREVADGERFADESSSSLQTALGSAFPDRPLRQLEAGLPLRAAAEGEGLLISNAGCEADLERLVEHFWEVRSEVVWVGSAGLTGVLARRLAGSGARSVAPHRHPLRPLLLVIGSRTERTRAEIDALLHAASWQPVQVLTPGAQLRKFVLDDITLLIFPEEDVGCEAATRMLSASALQEIGAGTRDVAVVGGETLGALVADLTPESVRVHGPAIAGFEAMTLTSKTLRADLRLFSRSGGFGRPGDLWSLCMSDLPTQAP